VTPLLQLRYSAWLPLAHDSGLASFPFGTTSRNPEGAPTLIGTHAASAKNREKDLKYFVLDSHTAEPIPQGAARRAKIDAGRPSSQFFLVFRACSLDLSEV
jgi:hypothetical protein